MKDVFVNRSAKHTLTQEEIDISSRSLAKKTSEIKYTEAEKTSAMAAYTSKLKQLEAEVSILADMVNNGYVYQEMKCPVCFDWKSGKKSVVHPETGEVIETGEITAEDRQLQMPVE
jgi:hypothetical protein